VINSLLAAKKTADYDCVPFALDVWHALTGDDISSFEEGFLAPSRGLAASVSARRKLVRIHSPVDPCFILFHGGSPPHVGVLTKGQVLHLKGSGAIRESVRLAGILHREKSYYVPSSSCNI
jgi:hypothetical protein